jgi:dipeptidyl aminopeptidase/acylaminoacyl peptidase
VLLAQEPRFKTAILRLGGFPLVETHPSMDPFNFISRVKIPVLMMNGKYDYIFPYETSQVPMFESFGAPPEDKRHVTFKTAHGVFPHRNEMIRETLDWLDRYLGKIETD